jgi:hypothetical protein
LQFDYITFLQRSHYVLLPSSFKFPQLVFNLMIHEVSSDHWPLPLTPSFRFVLPWHFTRPLIWSTHYLKYFYFVPANFKTQGCLSAALLPKLESWHLLLIWGGDVAFRHVTVQKSGSFTRIRWTKEPSEVIKARKIICLNLLDVNMTP